MVLTVRAVYESGNLRLLDEVELDEGQSVTLTIKLNSEDIDPERATTISELNSWLPTDREEVKEQEETLKQLMKALDENRTSNRKLFP